MNEIFFDDKTPFGVPTEIKFPRYFFEIEDFTECTLLLIISDG